MNKPTVLIVEDNPRIRRLLAAIVGQTATICDECGDGETALAAYQQHRPDWVLMDIKMPGTDGLAATAAILAADPGAHIVIVTGFNDPAIREAATRAGACGFVLKDNLLQLSELLDAAQ